MFVTSLFEKKVLVKRLFVPLRAYHGSDTDQNAIDGDIERRFRGRAREQMICWKRSVQKFAEHVPATISLICLK